MRTLVVQFSNSVKQYHYCYAGNKEPKPGDWAVVHNGSEFAVVTIQRAIPGVEPRVTKYALAIITQDDFNAYLEQNRQIEEYRSLEEQLAYRLKLATQRKKLKEMAEDDPQAQALIRRLEEFERRTMPVIEAEVPQYEAPPNRDIPQEGLTGGNT